jgi:hypothetical protein
MRLLALYMPDRHPSAIYMYIDDWIGDLRPYFKTSFTDTY